MCAGPERGQAAPQVKWCSQVGACTLPLPGEESSEGQACGGLCVRVCACARVCMFAHAHMNKGSVRDRAQDCACWGAWGPVSEHLAVGGAWGECGSGVGGDFRGGGL